MYFILTTVITLIINKWFNGELVSTMLNQEYLDKLYVSVSMHEIKPVTEKSRRAKDIRTDQLSYITKAHVLI